jgi:hypothetical protein
MAPPFCQKYNNETIQAAVSELVRNEAFEEYHKTRLYVHTALLTLFALFPINLDPMIYTLLPALAMAPPENCQKEIKKQYKKQQYQR